MTFTVTDLIFALAFGLIVGFFVVTGFNAQVKRESPSALAALQQRMGSLYSPALFAAGGLPLMVVGLLANSLRGLPSLGDLILLIVLIVLAMLGAFTLLGNAMKLLAERMPADRPG